MTECRLATVIFYFVTFVCTDHDLPNAFLWPAALFPSPSQKGPEFSGPFFAIHTGVNACFTRLIMYSKLVVSETLNS